MRQASESAAEVPLVSVGVPVFNGEAFLEDAIRSVLAQTLGDLELMLCDNASSDRTAEICRDYEARDAARALFPQPPQSGRGRQLQPGVQSCPRALLQMAGPR